MWLVRLRPRRWPWWRKEPSEKAREKTKNEKRKEKKTLDNEAVTNPIERKEKKLAACFVAPEASLLRSFFSSFKQRGKKNITNMRGGDPTAPPNSAKGPAVARLGGPCRHCLTSVSCCWRKGPPDKPVLCNACGSRFLVKANLEGCGFFAPCLMREEGERGRREGESERRAKERRVCCLDRSKPMGRCRLASLCPCSPRPSPSSTASRLPALPLLFLFPIPSSHTKLRHDRSKTMQTKTQILPRSKGRCRRSAPERWRRKRKPFVRRGGKCGQQQAAKARKSE